MKMILFNQNPMITKLLESVSKKLELSIENFNHYQELSAHLKKDPEWILIADDECLEKLDQVDWLELKETISQNKNSVCMYKKGNEAQPFLEGFEMKIKKPFLPTEVLKILQKKLGSNINELEPSQNLDPTQEVLETNWDELENLGDLEALVQEEPNNEEQLLPTLNDQKENEEVKEEKEEVKETPKEEEKPKDDETQEGETPKDKEVSKELEAPQELEIPKEETQEEQVKEQEPIKEETQEIKEEKQEKTQDSPSAQELEAMQELVKEIQENSNENKKETQESAETPQDVENQAQEIQDKETQESAETPQDVEIPQESVEMSQEKETQELEIPKEETQESTEIPQETPQDVETPQEKETPQTQEKETPKDENTQESVQNLQEKEIQKAQDETPQEDHYESIEDIPEPVMAKAMGEELPFLNEVVAKIPNNENDTETPKESDIKTPQEKEESDKTSSPLELRLNLQDLLKSLNQESLKSLLENKTLSIKITLEDKKPNA
ncbi:chemotaxis regulatory protein ChePep [Helicobacter pylori]|uniref:chemotaxis regulatory protein ChePep n=1 Tax=Helicobacter pylori TaxID=210 RepID=UPI000FDEAC11|nr:chemotaxis regulatory protein ChePep [Helicobacter pylori]RVY99013.1 hypothetical protein EC515_00705 [Helicobacter pylori]